MNSYKAIFAMVVATALWGAMGFFTRSLDQCNLEPLDITAIRVMITTAVLFAILAIFDRKSFILTKKLIPYAICLGLAKLIASFSMICALIMIPMAFANTLQTMYIFIVLFASSVLLSDMLTAKKVIAVVVAIAGCGLAIVVGDPSESINVIGVGLALLSAAGLAADALLVKTMHLKGAGPQTTLFYSYLIPSIILLPIVNLSGIFDAALNVEGAALDMFSLAVLATMVPYFLENWSYSKLNINVVAVLNSLQIVFATIIGYAFFSEELTPINIVGMAMVIIAIIVVNIDVGIKMNRIDMELARNMPGYVPSKGDAIKVGKSRFGTIRDRIYNADKDSIYKSLTSMFLEKKWRYETEGEYGISATFMGDDLVIDTDITVYDRVVKFNCILSLDAQREHYGEVLWELNRINDTIGFGSFRLNPDTGKICFQYSYLFIDARPTPMLLESLVSMVVQTVDDHDGYLKDIANGRYPASPTPV